MSNENIVQKEQEKDAQLELKDRMNYTYVLTLSLIGIEKALGDRLLSNRRIENMIYSLYYKIPETWKDEKFKADLTNCITTKQIDIRPVSCGIQLSIEVCKKLNMPISRQYKKLNVFKLFQSIINLYDRRQLLISKEKIEYTTGKNLSLELDSTIDDEVKKDMGIENEQP